jgi:hypothetical protein
MSHQHIDDDGKHVREIEGRLRALAAGYADAGSSDDFDELLIVIHRPGWTTPQDVAFMGLLIEAAERSVADALAIRSALVETARAIGAASAVAA